MSAKRSSNWARGLLLAAVVGAGAAVDAAPAQAQFFGWWGYRRFESQAALAGETVARRLGQAGYRVARIQRNGNVYLVDGIDPRGRSVRLVVDSMDGSILQRFATAAPHTSPDGYYQDSPPANLAPPSPAPSIGTQPPPPPRELQRRSRPEANIEPAKPSTPRRSTRPSEATRPSEVQEPTQSAASPRSPEQPSASAAPQPRRETPRPAPAPAAPPASSGPGYVNGVPINPLD